MEAAVVGGGFRWIEEGEGDLLLPAVDLRKD